MKINPRGYWENETSEGHGHDSKLASAIYDYLQEEEMKDIFDFTVIDIGCGDGYYTNYLLEKGIHCYGYDGNPNTEIITNGVCKVADFSQTVYLGNYDWVLSLEVGEHIPEEYESIFLDNLSYHAWEGIILSWAVPGQGGDGHVNCRDNEYIIKQMEDRNFKYAELDTEFLRLNATPYPDTGYWFKDTLMVFRYNKESR